MKNQNRKVLLKPAASRNDLPLAVLALAAVFREFRKKHKLSLNALAKLSNVSRQMLGYIETQTYFPSAEVIARVAAGLQLSFGEFAAAVDSWMLRQPACCHACKYACMAQGRLKWWNARRGCTRPIH